MCGELQFHARKPPPGQGVATAASAPASANHSPSKRVVQLRQMRRERSFAPILLSAFSALLALLVLLSHATAQDLSRRLILKDGSYQLVTKYEVKGDRVRYLSSEREEWEEMPASLVDWPATEQYEKDRAAGASTPE